MESLKRFSPRFASAVETAEIQASPYATPLFSPPGERPIVHEAQGTFVGSVFTLANSAIGAGVLAFPYAFKCAGVMLGTILCFILTILCSTTLHIIVSCCQNRPEARSYQDLVYLSGGVKAATVAEVTLVIYLFGSCVGFLVILGDMTTSLCQAWLGAESLFSSRAVIIASLTVCLVLPLTLLRSLASLRWASLVAILSVGYMVLMVVIDSFYHEKRDDIEYFRFRTTVFRTIPIVCFALSCHIQCPLVYTELRTSIRTVKNMDKIIFWAYGICMLTYLPAGIFGYLSYGHQTTPDLLSESNYPLSNIPADFARIGLTLTALACFAINHFPARSALYTLISRLRESNNAESDFSPSKTTQTTTTITATATTEGRKRQNKVQNSSGPGDTAGGTEDSSTQPSVAGCEKESLLKQVARRRSLSTDCDPLELEKGSLEALYKQNTCFRNGEQQQHKHTLSQSEKTPLLSSGHAPRWHTEPKCDRLGCGGEEGQRGGHRIIRSARSPSFSQRFSGSRMSGSCDRDAGIPAWVMPDSFHYMESILFVFVATVVAILVPDIAVVFDIIGATCGTCVIFFGPAWFWWKLGPEGGTLVPRAWLSLLLVICGAIIMVLGTAETMRRDEI